MTSEEIIQDLRIYVSEQILDGEDVGLEATTPLIEWGILNSMEIAQLVAFIHDTFAVDVPVDAVTLDNFKDLDSLAKLVQAYSESPA
jgi:acyl carrier protein